MIDLPPDSTKLDALDFSHITEHLHFNLEEGRIWLQDQRMALVHTEALAAMRTEIVDALGARLGRRLLTRTGYSVGVRDADFARKLRSQQSPATILTTITQLHALQGFIQTEPRRVEIDSDLGHCYAEFLWNNGVEDEMQVAAEGIGHESACWMGVGYISGIMSKITGKRILAREVECRATGQSRCLIIAKPAEHWDDIEDELFYLGVEPTKASQSSARSTKCLSSSAASTTTTSTGSVPNDDTSLVGASVSFNSALHQVRRVATTRATVLLLGESGTGKSAIAREVHRFSGRANQSFVEVNCAAIPESLLESELFGVERGAFSGASEPRAGRFEAANGGTLFLDEIGILSFSAQGKLLRVLQSGEFERLGSTRTIKLDVRVVAATNEDLPRAVQEGRFREDLFYRINVFPVELPPLRQRREDLPLLLDYFVDKFSNVHGRRVSGITARALQAILNHEWPGNIREFENVIERGTILLEDDELLDVRHLFSVDFRHKNARLMRLSNSGDVITEQATPQQQSTQQTVADDVSPTFDLERWATDAVRQRNANLSVLEDALVNAAISDCGGNLSKAATILGLTRAQIAYRAKRDRA
jgi:two-component system, NtrC family, response regulator HydG